MSGVALLALGASAVAAVRRPAVALRLAVPFALAAALAAVQIVPTAGRLAGSPRRGLGFAEATVWSMPPARLVEMVFPRFFGDPPRDLEGLFFGGGINDRGYPYVESLYPGLLLTVLGAAALLGGGIPRRAAWALAFGAGCFLALGRHNPLYGALRRAVPPLAVLRYPEKFAVLAVLALAVAGVLGWQRLLDERRAGRPGAASLPLALAALVLAAAVGLALALRLAPGAFPVQGAAGLPYLRGESLAAVATAAAVCSLLALCRWGGLSERGLQGLAVTLLAADLWHYGHGLVRSVPADLYLAPPPLAAALSPDRGRVFAEPLPEGAVDLVVDPVKREGDLATVDARNQVAKLQPFSGLLWRLPYVFDVDFDLTLTPWGQRAEEVFRQEWARPRQAWRYLGVWNVGDALLRVRRPSRRNRGSRYAGRPIPTCCRGSASCPG